MSWHRVVATGALALVAGEAGAEICYSDARPGLVPAPSTASTLFDCPVAGRRTVGELAAAGYLVVKLKPVTVSQSDSGPLVSEQLVIEREVRIFSSGFE